MSVPLSILLLPLAVFLLLFFVFSLINLIHIIKFASFDAVGFSITFIFLAVSTLFLWYSYQLLNPINWTEPINFSLNVFTQLPQ
jgi:hypothetical protein